MSAKEIYDTLTNDCCGKENIDFYKNIFQNLKTSEDSIVLKKFASEHPKRLKDYYKYIDVEKLKIKSKEDLDTIEKILSTIITKSIVMRYKYDSKEKAREDYLRQLEYLKYGILK